jgi:predicted  nucleic acid-binding Zn-ribbon protein
MRFILYSVMSENETYMSQLRDENSYSTTRLYAKLEQLMNRNQTQDNLITDLQTRVNKLEQELLEIRHLLSGRQFLQRSLSYENAVENS